MILKGFVEVKATHTDIQQYKHRRLTLSCTLIGWLFKAVSERTTLSKTFGFVCIVGLEAHTVLSAQCSAVWLEYR